MEQIVDALVEIDCTLVMIAWMMAASVVISLFNLFK